MKEAFSYMFREKDFVIKALPYCLFTLAVQFFMLYAYKFISPAANTVQPQYFLFFFLALFSAIIPIGFMYSSLKSLLEQRELPFINIMRDLVTGLKFIAGWILLMIIYIIIVLLAILVLGVPMAIIAKINPLMGGLAFVLSAIAYVLCIFIFFAYIPALSSIFAKTGKITSFLCIRKATRLIKQGVGTYFKGIGLLILCSIAFAIFNNIIIFCTVKAGVLGISIGSVITAVLATYIMYSLIAVVAKSVKAECIE